MGSPASLRHGRTVLRPTGHATTVVVGGTLLMVAAAAVRWSLLFPLQRLLAEGDATSYQVMPTDMTAPLEFALLTALGALVVIRSEMRRYGWLLFALGMVAGTVGVAGEYAVYATLTGDASLPLTTVAGWVQDWWMTVWLLAFLLLPATFPDGTVAAGWRWPVRITAVAWIVLIGVFVAAERPMSNFLTVVDDPPRNPTGFLPVPEMAINVTWVLVSLASLVIGIGSLVGRWRGANTELRQRMKWVLYAFVVMLSVALLDVVYQAVEAGLGLDLGLTWPLSLVQALTTLGLVVGLAFGVLKLRLFDVDLVINRTIVYAALTVVVVATYVLVVVGVGAVVPVDDTVLSLVTTGIVAVAFAPLRAVLQRGANRLMFGQRDDPYAVLSEMGRLLSRSGAPDATLRTLAETVATALKLPGAAVELEQDGDWQVRATHGRLPDPDDRRVVVPLEHQGEVVGRLVVAPRSPREPLSPQDHRLLEDIAHQAGALAHAVRLTLALQRSREGLVLAREEERRRIRRDLHDGLGPTLASQTFRLDAVLERLQDDPAAAADLVAALKHQNQELVADIRRLVYELRPPALDDLGVAGALTAHAGQLDRTDHLAIDVETSPDPLPPLPAAVEVAAYRIAREAITNVVRHAGASRCTITLAATGAVLTVEVLDDGTGLLHPHRPGVGLTSMRERAEELGGSIEVTAASPSGTRVRATLPMAASPPSRANGVRPTHERTGAQHG